MGETDGGTTGGIRVEQVGVGQGDTGDRRTGGQGEWWDRWVGQVGEQVGDKMRGRLGWDSWVATSGRQVSGTGLGGGQKIERQEIRYN